MKFPSVVFVAMLICAVAVHTTQSSSITVAELREFIECVDSVFDDLSEEHIKLEKYHSEYKILAKNTNIELDECERKPDAESKRVCIENATLMFSMLRMTEIIEEIEKESKTLSDLFMKTVSNKCDKRN